MDKDWRKVRDIINEELGNNKPSMLEEFTILPFDFSFDVNFGRINFGYIDQDLVFDIAKKYDLNFILDILSRAIYNDINLFISDRPQYNNNIPVKIRQIIHEKFKLYIVHEKQDDLMGFLNELRDILYRDGKLDKKNLM